MVTDEFMKGAIIGFIEGEGNIEPSHRVIRVGNTDKELLLILQQYLQANGVDSRITKYNVHWNKKVGNRKPVYRLTITHRINLVKIYEFYEHFESAKKKKLKSILDSYKRKIYIRRGSKMENPGPTCYKNISL